MSANENLAGLSAAGVSVWLDDISRERLETGNLKDLIAGSSVVGVTSNPSIFAAALAKGSSYDDQITDLAVRKVSVEEAARAITTFDIRWAADVLAPVFETTGGQDGRVSIEVDPRLAHETQATIAEAKALWWAVDRPNTLIKIPATKAGLPAITAAIAAGISVNVTLIFSLERYREVMDAYMAGLESAKAAGIDLSQIRSVASFFVSRVDAEIDKRLDGIGGEKAQALKGKAAIANARLAYQEFENVVASPRWAALAAAGAHPQRPLWASTSVKNPDYRDVHLRRGPRRPRHRQHDARGHHARLRRPRRDRVRHHPPVLRRRRRASCSAWSRSASTTRTSSRSSRTRAWRNSSSAGSSCWTRSSRSSARVESRSERSDGEDGSRRRPRRHHRR